MRQDPGRRGRRQALKARPIEPGRRGAPLGPGEERADAADDLFGDLGFAACAYVLDAVAAQQVDAVAVAAENTGVAGDIVGENPVGAF